MTHLSPGAPAPDIERLRSAITDIDAFSQGALSEIASIAKLALLWLEQPASYQDTEVIAHALSAILGKAKDYENLINCEAENVGCNWCDPATARRYAAHHIARKSEVQS